MALTNKLTAIADAIREKTGTENKLTLDEMPVAIAGITTGEGSGECDLPHIPLTITGDCNHMFNYGAWEWIIEEYGDRITTENITVASRMFYYTELLEIPFDINLRTTSPSDVQYIFANSKLKKVPYVKGKISSFNSIFSDCNNLIEIPDDWADYMDWSYIHSYNTGINKNFQGCKSLRKIPQTLIDNLYCNILTTYSNFPQYSGFDNCYILEEVNNLPISITPATITSNTFYYTFRNCNRLKAFTFAMQEDGTPYIADKYKSQTIDLSSNVGWAGAYGNITGLVNYHGIGTDKEVKDDTTYAALKNDPDWWTTNVKYSRYNHDSAVETINSLPDVSGSGGTNTIKFKGAAGSATDGGAINTLTEEEIAVAAAKGWTVSLV